MGQLTPPVLISDFKTLFTRDFQYGPGIEAVRDVDIQNSLNMASALFNADLFDLTLVGISPNQTSEAKMAYLYVSAHILVSSIQSVGGLGKSGKGVFSQGEGMITGKGAGGININFAWPAMITDSPLLFQFTKTAYGCKYLDLLTPKLVGNVGAIYGEVTGQPNIPFF